MVTKVIELVGSSTQSWEDAARAMVREASQSLRNIRSIEVAKQSAHVDEHGVICEFCLTLHVSFAVEHHSHLLETGVELSTTRY